MTDEELVEPKTIVECVEADGGGWDVILSCGHAACFVIRPGMGETFGCAQCIDLLIENRKKVK